MWATMSETEARGRGAVPGAEALDSAGETTEGRVEPDLLVVVVVGLEVADDASEARADAVTPGVALVGAPGATDALRDGAAVLVLVVEDGGGIVPLAAAVPLVDFLSVDVAPVEGLAVALGTEDGLETVGGLGFTEPDPNVPELMIYRTCTARCMTDKTRAYTSCCTHLLDQRCGRCLARSWLAWSRPFGCRHLRLSRAGSDWLRPFVLLFLIIISSRFN
ncbi:hypothetical protein NEOLEDRAFT_28584 [Neolentinus lepideus HHB14362 ss-1]|uniref:Uncharacterized protein n=1 Tax=Neolentinus lepideus HHB14362 ss-1 TaxID=1314782 RepID=A0A165W5E7_9AGAM|nr:hypothetical protein NEOLEDRAFT_28584 [Neolentinus lepideus HHB14362 ss-1]